MNADSYEQVADKIVGKIGAQKKVNGQDGGDVATLAWPQPLDLESLAERDPEPPRFILADMLPVGYATLLAGHGGVGKSTIALYLAVCIAAGIPFFGVEAERRRVLYLSAEDRVNVLHWRLRRICAHLELDLAPLRGWLDVLDLVGHPAVLWQRDPRTGAALTPAYGALDARMREQRTELLVVDGVADAFGGNENVRCEVKTFVNALLALISADSGAVLLVGHVNRPSASAGATGDGYSGSTQWHNAVRARWYLYPETRTGEDGERPERTGDLILELQKSNHGPVDARMRFAWDEDAHLFLGRGVLGASPADRAHRDRVEQHAILAALDGCTEPVPAAASGQRTAFHVLSARPEFPHSLRDGAAGRRRFWRHIEALRQFGSVEVVAYRRKNRHVAEGLALTTEGKRQCA